MSMAYESTVRKVAEDVFLFVCLHFKVIKDEPTPESRIIPNIPARLMNNLKPTIFMENFFNELLFEEFFKHHFQRMTSSPYRFVTYGAYACYVLINESNAYFTFLNTLSIMTHFAYHCLIKGSKIYINICSAFVCEFFEKEIRDKFERQGGWKSLNEFILNYHFLKKSKELIRNNTSPYEYFKSLKDVNSINDLICRIKGINISNVTQMQVETDRNAVEFANSVRDKMEEIFKQPLGEIFINSVITDDQAEDNKAEESCRAPVAQVSGCMASNEDPSTSGEIPDEASGDIPDATKTVEQDVEKETTGPLQTRNARAVNYPGGSSPALPLNPKSRKSERAKELLDGLWLDIGNLASLIKSLCDEHGVQAPIPGEADTEV